MNRLPLIRRFLRPALAAGAVWFASVVLVSAADTPAPPATPLNRLVQQLAAKKPAGKPAPAPEKRREELLRPEFRFRPAGRWLFLPDLARQLSTNETERAAVLELLDKGTTEARRLLAAEGAENDVVAATTLFLSQLWGFVRETEPAEAHVDALHAQLAATFAGPDILKMSDADKQRYWEFCIAMPIFVLGMKEVVSEPGDVANLRTIASACFESLLGVKAELVDLGAQGLVVRAGLEQAARELAAEKASSAAPTAKSGPGKSPTSAPAAPSAPGAAAAGMRSGIRYTAPAGWSREDAAWATIFRATLRDVNDRGEPEANTRSQHGGSIFILPPRALPGSAQAAFEAGWREQFDAFELGDTVVHYRSRLKCGLVVHYMGRFFHRRGAAPERLKEYAVLYVIELGGGRMQLLTAVAEPNDPDIGMGSFKESRALQALSYPLAALLDSITPAQGPAPYPAGGYFVPGDLQGDWSESSSAFGGFYVNASTGASAGVAVHSSGGTFRLRRDGTYDYSFAYATTNPQFGNSRGSTKHSGTYRLDGDIVLVQPKVDPGYKFTCCAVGIGTRRTPEGVKRVLVTVSSDRDGVFRAPPLIPNWDAYAGTMSWYVEK